jgi:predicted dehydrogenase
LPAALAHPGVRLAALVDLDLKRANALRQTHALDCQVASDCEALLGKLDAVIIALPNHLHTPVTLEALHAGVNVLCEKPLATTAADASVCCATAAKNKVLLAVGMNRRFEAGNLMLHQVLGEGLLGPLQEYDWEYGAPWDWDTASGFYFSRAQAGGGVLIDFGVHVLDSLIDWFGPVTRFEYQDDNWGSGLEANATLNLRHTGRYGEVSGRVRLSRTYTLKNRLLVRGAQSRAELLAQNPSLVVLYRKLGRKDVSMTLGRADLQRTPAHNSFYAQLDNFVESIHGAQRLVVDGRQALEVLELVECSYARAGRIPEPWSEIGSLREVGG